MKFQKPGTDYIEEVNHPFFRTLLFGPVYFIIKGVWTHALASAFLAFFTCGVSWLFYPFYAKEVIRNHFLKEGWREIK